MWPDKASLNIQTLGQYHASVTYLRYTVLMNPNKGEAAVHCCDPALSVLVMLVSRNVFHVVSALPSIVFMHFFGWLDLLYILRGSVYRMRSLAVCVPYFHLSHLITFTETANKFYGRSERSKTKRVSLFHIKHTHFNPKFFAQLLIKYWRNWRVTTFSITKCHINCLGTGLSLEINEFCNHLLTCLNCKEHHCINFVGI